MKELSQIVLGDACEQIIDFRGRTPKKLGLSWGGGNIPALSANNVQMGKIDFTKECYLGGENLYQKWMTKGDCKKGDIIFTMEAPLGNVAQIPDSQKYILSQRVVLLRPDKSRADEDYLAQYMRSPLFQKIIMRKASGSTAKGIQQKQLVKILIYLPSIEQQKQISRILFAWDRAIGTLVELIEAKTKLKKGLMQKLLAGKIRFNEFKNDKWRTFTLNECCFILDNKRKPLNEGERSKMRGDIPYYGANGLVDYVNDYIFDEELILMAEDGGYFDEFATRPIAYLISGKSWVNNHAHVLKAKEGFCQHLIFYCLVHKNLSKYLNSGTRSKLNHGELEKIEIDLPVNFNEQKRIADVLLSSDRAIDAMTSFSEKLKNQKKGLMQKLLTGKIRVNI